MWAIPDEPQLAAMEALLTQPWKVTMTDRRAVTPEGNVFDDVNA